MTRAAAAVVLVAAAVAATGCQTTQELSAHRAKNAKKLANRTGLRITRANPDVKVGTTDIVQDASGVAAVVEVRNAGRPAVGLPVLIAVTDKRGKRVYANDAPGLEPSLVSLPYLRKGQRAFWVDNQIPAVGGASKVRATIGAARGAAPAKVPEFSITRVALGRDSSGALLKGYIANRSAVDQKRLVISCVARRGGRVVAAGRAIVDRLGPKGAKPQLFRIFFIGNPKGAKLTLFAPPTVLR
ncbi:MAG: hypothetical protein M3P44_16620 [Actinomycetota bacterium]|nr:hypothetical protein [Actinomycetota bacterium]